MHEDSATVGCRGVRFARALPEDALVPEAVNEEAGDSAWMKEHIDTWTGDALDPRLVSEARHEELSYLKEIEVYEQCTLQDCWEKTGKAPISNKWVEITKGTSDCPDIRCRLVARDFRGEGEGHRDDLFAAMPPWEAKCFLFMIAVSTDPVRAMLIDVKSPSQWECRHRHIRMYRTSRRRPGKRDVWSLSWSVVWDAAGGESSGGRLHGEASMSRLCPRNCSADRVLPF
jgi:hypothetical protein